MNFFECCSSGISAAEGSVGPGTALPDSPGFSVLQKYTDMEVTMT
jgi:hypothetical protein